MDFLKIAFELVVGYAALFILTKILGKTQITQITAFDFISALVLGELVGNAVFDQDIGIREILFAVFCWCILIFTTEMATQKFKRVRKLLEGEPSIIIHKGKIVYNQLKKNRLDINQLQHLLRSKDVFSIRECEYALLETDGTVSVLKKSDFASPTRQDLSLPSEQVGLPITLVLDGEAVYDNLNAISKDLDWLKKELKQQGIPDIKNVLYAEWEKDKALHVQTY
ncbi:DUF421 domain-containing protein [Bacillus litorisediminis]|uniref:DUF421 domain-containing protein n=1 Tax=Bacillus litorisediminis TaxID=2922713 RepID=UPI001FAB560C|nr:DUF421 domain-containing protein [Bacillus litorisediminis]